MSQNLDENYWHRFDCSLKQVFALDLQKDSAREQSILWNCCVANKQTSSTNRPDTFRDMPILSLNFRDRLQFFCVQYPD